MKKVTITKETRKGKQVVIVTREKTAEERLADLEQRVAAIEKAKGGGV